MEEVKEDSVLETKVSQVKDEDQVDQKDQVIDKTKTFEDLGV